MTNWAWLWGTVQAVRWEIFVWMLIASIISVCLYDFIWTWVFSNPRAAAHFARDNWKSIGFTTFVVFLGSIALLGWMY